VKPSEVLERIFYYTENYSEEDSFDTKEIKELLLDCSYLLNTMIDRIGNGRF
jgi:hypothetical protein